MYERHVLVKLNDDWATEERIAEVRSHSESVLSKLPGVQSMRSGIPSKMHGAKGWDLCFVMGFAREEDIEPYRVHPDHLAFLNDFLLPKTAAKRVWNFSMRSGV